MNAYREKLDWFPDFDDRDWFDAAIETKVRGGKDTHKGIRARFRVFRDEYYWIDPQYKEDTHWYRFQEAVKDHERFALKMLLDRVRGHSGRAILVQSLRRKNRNDALQCKLE